MKKTKLVTIIAAVLVLATLVATVSSCRVETYSIKSYINSYGEYKSTDTVLSQAKKVDGLKNATMLRFVGDLFHFVSYESNDFIKHMIYSPESNEIIATYTDSVQNSYEINLYSNAYLGNYYTVVTATYQVNEGGTRTSDTPTYTTDLYTEDGQKIGSATGAVDVKNVADMIYFDGKMYGQSTKKGESTVKYLFDYSPLADMPYVDKVGKYYYEFDSERLTVYNSKLEMISGYTVPEYADELNFSVLENGNVLLQYYYTADENSDDYDLLLGDGNETAKYYLITLIVNCKNGKTKEIRCDYVFEEIDNLNDTYKNADFKYPMIAEARALENKRLSEECTVFVDNNGKVIEIEDYKGLSVSSIVPVAEGRWKLRTSNGKSYLLDKRAALVGEITNANVSFSDKFIGVSG